MPRPDSYVLECAFESNPEDALSDQVWTDISRYLDVKAGVRIGRGRADEFSDIQPSTMALTLKNDGRFTPDRNRNMIAGDDSDFAVGLGGWQVSTGCTIARVGTEFFGATVGSLRITSTGTGTAEAKLVSSAAGTDFRVRGGHTYRIGFASKAGSVGRTTQLVVNWYDALGIYISSAVVSRVDDTASFTYTESVVTAPENAHRYELFAQVLAPGGAGELHYFDVFTVSTSVFYPNVQTGKRIRLGVLRKGNGKQIDTDPSFTGSAPFGGSNSLYPWQSKPGFPTVGISSTSAFAQSGSTSMLLTLPTAAGANAIVRKFVYGLVAGRQYTASAYLRVPTGVPAMVFGCTPGGTSVTTVNDAFQRRTITFTATGPSCELYVYNNAGSTAGQLVYVDAVQVEEGASATAFDSTAGVFTWRFTGDVNEWPTGWEGGPALYAESNLTATDRFKRLGDLGELRTTLDEDILDDVPFAYYPLNEPAGVGGSTVSAGDVSGNDETPLTPRQYGSGGSITFGSEPGIPDFYAGRRTTVAINPASAGNGAYLRATLKNPQSSDIGATVAAFAMESVTALPTGPIAILTASNGSWFGVRKSSAGAFAGEITAAFYDNETGDLHEVDPFGATIPNNTSVLLTAVLEYDNPTPGDARLTFWLNGVQFGTGVSWIMKPVTWTVASVGGRGAEMFRGYISHAAFFNEPVTSGAYGGWWYSAYRGTDGAGSTSYARLNKLCEYTGLETPLLYSGPSFAPKSVGPLEIEGQPLDSMRKVEATEDGQFFLRADGRSLLRLRSYRYNANPLLTIAADMIDPESVSFRGDDFGLVNDFTATRSDGASARIVNEASKAQHGRRKGQLDAIAVNDDDLRALTAWRVNTWGTQRNRITGLRVSMLNHASLLPTALTLDIGHRIRITDLPDQAPSATVDLYLEGWVEVLSESEWSMAFNTSPADPWDVWQIGVAGRSEIGTTTRIGYALLPAGLLAPSALLGGQAGPTLPAATAGVLLAVLGSPWVAGRARRLLRLGVRHVPSAELGAVALCARPSWLARVAGAARRLVVGPPRGVLSPDVAGVRLDLDMPRVAAPAVVTDDVVKVHPGRDRSAVERVEQPVDVPHPTLVPDLRPAGAGVRAGPPEAVTVADQARPDLTQLHRFSLPARVVHPISTRKH